MKVEHAWLSLTPRSWSKAKGLWLLFFEHFSLGSSQNSDSKLTASDRVLKGMTVHGHRGIC